MLTSTDFRLGDVPIISGTLYMPRVGNWSADLYLDGEVAPTGKVVLSVLDQNLSGHVIRSGISEGRLTAIVAGGAGGLANALQAKLYQGVPASLPLREILSEAKESLSAASTASVLSQGLPKWVRSTGTADRQLSQLTDALNAIWRVLDDGTVFVGLETWKGSPDIQWDKISEDPAQNTLTLASETAVLRPGQTFDGRKISAVTYHLSPESFRQTVYFFSGETEDAIRSGLLALVQQELRGLDYLAFYAGQVVTQRADGTLDLRMDDPRLPDLTSVPIRLLPGCSVKVAAGSRVLVGFEGGSPSRYYATLWETGAGSLRELRLAGSVPVALKGGNVDCGVLVLKFIPPATISATYTPPGGTAQEGLTIALQGKITDGSSIVKAAT